MKCGVWVSRVLERAQLLIGNGGFEADFYDCTVIIIL